VLLIGAIWIVVTGLLARSDLLAARREADAAKAALIHGDVAKARALAAQLRDRAGSAHARTTGPAWAVASSVPWAGAPLASIREVADEVDVLAMHALTPAMNAGIQLDPDKVILGHGHLDLSRISAAEAPLNQASQVVTTVAHTLSTGHANTWLGTVDSNRTTVVDSVTKLQHTLSQGVLAARLLPPMLGENGPRHYFVGFENTAESRGLGGLPGSYGILSADHGRVHFTRFGADIDLGGATSSVSFGRDWRARYIDTYEVNTNFVNTTASPHFPYAADLWLSMWQQKFGQHLDGAIATDPTALGYLLGATGPVTLADGQPLNSSNAVQVLENGVYAKFPQLTPAAILARKNYLVDAAKTIASHVTDQADNNPTGLVDALKQAVGEHRLVAFSDRSSEETQLAVSSLAGGLSDTRQPFADLVINNSAGSKLDYYLDRSLTYERSTCNATTATVTVKLTNTAPASGLAKYVSTTIGLGRGPVGVNQDEVSLYLTHGADLSSLTVDGKRAFMQTEQERGHPVVSLGVRLNPGQSKTLVYRIAEPTATGPVVTPVQPLVRPMHVDVRSPSCAA
jgi:hypothetical protein